MCYNSNGVDFLNAPTATVFGDDVRRGFMAQITLDPTGQSAMDTQYPNTEFTIGPGLLQGYIINILSLKLHVR